MFDWLKKLIVGETPLDLEESPKGQHKCKTCGIIKLDRKFAWPTAKICRACKMREYRKKK